MSTKLVGVYLRCSTAEQSTEMQRRDLLAFAGARGWVIHEVYEDLASTGTNDRRSQFQLCLKDARARKFDVLLCWKLDRFARNLKDLITHLQELTELGVECVFLKDQLDQTTPAGRLMTHMISAFAEFEADLIRSRVVAGIANARARGTRFGRPQQVNIDEVRRLRSLGQSLGAIAKKLGISKSAVHKTLSKSAVTKPDTKPEIIKAGDK